LVVNNKNINYNMFYKSLFELAGVAHLPRAKLLIEQEIIQEGFKEAQAEFTQASSPEQAQQIIAQFRDLVNRNQVQGNERNIDYWRKRGWEQFSEFVSNKSQEKSKKQIKQATSPGKSIILHEDPNWLVVIPLDKEASCFHGRSTSWCTTKPHASHFEEYFYDKKITLVYFLNIQSGNKWALAASDSGTMELFDQDDNTIDQKQFQQQTGFDPVEYQRRVTHSQDVASQTNTAREQYQAAVERLYDQVPFTEVNRAVERDLIFTKEPRLTMAYCEEVKGRWPEAEPWIMRNSDTASKYARRVLKKRWPQAERFILDPDQIIHEIEHGEDAGENMIGNLALYATGAIRGRWVEAEPWIALNWYIAENIYCDKLGISPDDLNRDLPEKYQAIVDELELDED
jgi:hypothetical protein